MEGRVSRGRGGGWRRGGGRGGNDGEGTSGEHRGRGRGGHHRGRGKRDHHRGRGRGGVGRAADFHQRDRGEDDTYEQEEEEDGGGGGGRQAFSRRKLESNWDRYEASEKAEADDDTPARRGTDFSVLLESAGDSFSQFRFAEEKEWEMDPFIESQMSLVSLDLNVLAETLQQLPLHQRLNLESELLEVAMPAELPALPTKPNVPKTSKFVPPAAALQDLKVPAGSVSSAAAAAAAVEEEEEEDADEELEQLLRLQKHVSVAAGESGGAAADQEVTASQKPCEDVKEEKEEEEEEAQEEDATPPKAVKQEMTEEDLEDWLDSMIS